MGCIGGHRGTWRRGGAGPLGVVAIRWWWHVTACGGTCPMGWGGPAQSVGMAANLACLGGGSSDGGGSCGGGGGGGGGKSAGGGRFVCHGSRCPMGRGGRFVCRGSRCLIGLVANMAANLARLGGGSSDGGGGHWKDAPTGHDDATPVMLKVVWESHMSPLH